MAHEVEHRTLARYLEEHNLKHTKQRDAIQAAHERYLALDCERLGHRVEMAKIELDYAGRVRDAYINLRQFAAASTIEVMRWNYNTEIAQKKVAHATRRAASCRGDK